LAVHRQSLELGRVVCCVGVGEFVASLACLSVVFDGRIAPAIRLIWELTWPV
jgi:hypothetical protein